MRLKKQKPATVLFKIDFDAFVALFSGVNTIVADTPHQSSELTKRIRLPCPRVRQLLSKVCGDGALQSCGTVTINELIHRDMTRLPPASYG